MHEEGMNPQYLSNTTTPIIEDNEHTTNMSVETQKDTFIDTQPTQLIGEHNLHNRLGNHHTLKD